MQQGRVIVTTLLQTWIFLSYDLVADIDFDLVATVRSCHSYDLVADIDFARCNKVVS